MEHEDIVKEVGATKATLIGEGQESTVYDLHDERVLKVLKRPNAELIEKEKMLYEKLASAKAPFRFPHILQLGRVGDTQYLMEEKLDGVPMDKVLAQIKDSEDRKELLRAMLVAIQSMRDIHFANDQYGELISVKPLQAATWSECFLKKVNQAIEKNRALIEANNPFGADFQKRYIERATALLDGVIVERSLVHGDYWPPNILVEGKNVTAVIDFNEQTMIGDYRVDVVSAVELGGLADKWLTKEEKQWLMDEACTMFGNDLRQYMDLYLVYYALLFIGADEASDEFQWAKGVLAGCGDMQTVNSV